MKNDATTTLLNFVLAVLVILSLVFAGFYVYRTHVALQLQSKLQTESQMTQAGFQRIQALMNEVVAYNSTAKNPELAQIIQSIQSPQQPAAK